MKIRFILFVLTMSILSGGACGVNNSTQDMQAADETTKQKMFNLAYIYQSTAPYYVVATIKNKNTGEIKEVCTEAPFLEGALYREYEKDYSYNVNLDSITSRYFELSKDSALWNISFDLYTQEELLSYKSTLNIDSITNLVKKEKYARKYFTSKQCDNNEREMFAHIMFDYGIMMRRGCIASNNCGLVLYDSTKVEVDCNYY